MDLSLSGVKPGSVQSAGPKLAIGERLSMCGKFAINAQGTWRELPMEQQQVQPHEFIAVGGDGKPLAGAANRS
eukprot:CAMPEP_0202868210 /NCGR_PEP_ID=MMETSP1391-20130828/10458_1 /ASSEMBLY_ACC=CAM_ASM_000867 /TAXON_ID=1034604 /ORGANISM="Chlamydomonas leiostraca, Strain SAG 11-49" /LENGTH=72 /DNA_ID=CAMNT_0049548345 /DNA_START=53 /DNA_END=274 /DNA_ORIENTATION=+